MSSKVLLFCYHSISSGKRLLANLLAWYDRTFEYLFNSCNGQQHLDVCSSQSSDLGSSQSVTLNSSKSLIGQSPFSQADTKFCLSPATSSRPVRHERQYSEEARQSGHDQQSDPSRQGSARERIHSSTGQQCHRFGRLRLSTTSR